ncbi:hypothetical protein [Halobacillus halophilus]|uniref:hypothetical protein n=1 Tax=Halobacillus halophilus TaxID=1570 RepID=UPI001CD1C563|nr:hypothetical protein [Halobacillus halophilus]MCA1011669.1 hypothetical protein [Halobacillus halophilus]
MREFLLIIVSLLITDFLSSQVYALIHLEYRLFHDKFDPGLFLLDFGIFLLIAMMVYPILRKLFFAGRSVHS